MDALLSPQHEVALAILRQPMMTTVRWLSLRVLVVVDPQKRDLVLRFPGTSMFAP